MKPGRSKVLDFKWSKSFRIIGLNDHPKSFANVHFDANGRLICLKTFQFWRTVCSRPFSLKLDQKQNTNNLKSRDD